MEDAKLTRNLSTLVVEACVMIAAAAIGIADGPLLKILYCLLLCLLSLHIQKLGWRIYWFKHFGKDLS